MESSWNWCGVRRLSFWRAVAREPGGANEKEGGRKIQRNTTNQRGGKTFCEVLDKVTVEPVEMRTKDDAIFNRKYRGGSASVLLFNVILVSWNTQEICWC